MLLHQNQQPCPVYLDCCASTPIEPRVRDVVIEWIKNHTGNAGSRTHEYGLQAKKAIQNARRQIATVVDATEDEVLFTSGATESNNLAILGLAEFGKKEQKQHIISTAIEHKAVLEPIEFLRQQGFEVTLIPPQKNGAVDPDNILSALRPDTLLVSVMHANNETGALQPIEQIAKVLCDHNAYFHVDAAQGFGKDIETLKNSRIDLISISGHKIYAPVGIGALIRRKRGYNRIPLQPLVHGGGQERGLRAGTQATPLIVGLGLAAEIAFQEYEQRIERCKKIQKCALEALETLKIRLHASLSITMPHVINFSVPGINSEAIMITCKDIASISNGSACTSTSYTPSHVLKASGLPEDAVSGALRISWSHLTPEFDWNQLVQRIQKLM